MPTMRLIKLPFEGFYGSRWSAELDSIEAREVETLSGKYGDTPSEADHPPELRLSEDEIADVLMRVTDYSAMHQAAACAYTDAFNHVVSQALGLSLRLTFESMSSPREYNFETDRVFSHIPTAVVDALFQRSAADEHKALAEIIRERFTSCSGFISYYTTDLVEWLTKPLADWDHNELETLLLACIRLACGDGDDWVWRVFETVCDGDGLYEEWSCAVDWTRFEAECADIRADKREAWKDEHPAEVLAVERCPHTLDMFRDWPPHHGHMAGEG